MLCPGKQKHATTVYHIIWAELAEDTLTVSFVERKKKTWTVCIKARLRGSTKEEAREWVEDLLNVAYKGAIQASSLWEGQITNFTPIRHQAEQEAEGIRESILRQGNTSAPSSSRALGDPEIELNHESRRPINSLYLL
jgi:hypothetical protein